MSQHPSTRAWQGAIPEKSTQIPRTFVNWKVRGKIWEPGEQSLAELGNPAAGLSWGQVGVEAGRGPDPRSTADQTGALPPQLVSTSTDCAPNNECMGKAEIDTRSEGRGVAERREGTTRMGSCLAVVTLPLANSNSHSKTICRRRPGECPGNAPPDIFPDFFSQTFQLRHFLQIPLLTCLLLGHMYRVTMWK
ncbi:hypothetical protein FIBSPDRAFT_494535 [Athelia psychrophila]|uniref:Uncharacterized protein n=1 Tax=Athelia psychrophila TaxID=1759441 RepID=A0A166KI20_9AGAM|nr:hypothetical protein FIBSPDRAFT_494535 [Fibularhizoctonia sp. CBS 109695]